MVAVGEGVYGDLSLYILNIELLGRFLIWWIRLGSKWLPESCCVIGLAMTCLNDGCQFHQRNDLAQPKGRGAKKWPGASHGWACVCVSILFDLLVFLSML